MKSRPSLKTPIETTRAPRAWEQIPLSERSTLMLIAVVAVGMRFALSSRISIEHWDEAVYSCNRFFPDGSYPGRYLYAPPLVPALIELAMLVGGATSNAAVLPNLLLSALTVILCWWAAREWFGRGAGLSAAALAALNDFHIAYSRTALTDPALCFWFLLAVYCTWRAFTRNRLLEAVVAGVAAGAAWATKYNGWLTLAVALSGFVAWGIFERFDRRQWQSRLVTLGTIFLAAGITWSPVWFSFQAGQYSEVLRNQAGYYVGWAGWTESFARQAANLRFFENWLSAASIAAALALPIILYRRLGILALAVILGLEAIPVGISPLLVGPALVGPFLILWTSYRRGQSDDAARSRRLAAWLLAAWNIGLFLATPAYKPYPRLVMPWLISAILATAAVCSLLFEPAPANAEPGRKTRKILRWGLIAAWILYPLATLQFRSVNQARFHFEPRSGAHPSAELTVGRLSISERAHSNLPIPGWLDRTSRGREILSALGFVRGNVEVALQKRPMHFISYGEPAIVFHLNANGIDASPVADFAFLAPGQPRMTQPAFLMALPNSPAEFDRLIAPYVNRQLESEAFLRETPSAIVLLDKYPPSDLVGFGLKQEDLRLYRVDPPAKR
jgi:4-amino-4-deoxy-L-arabinose transferase-like glycosyltransferase